MDPQTASAHWAQMRIKCAPSHSFLVQELGLDTEEFVHVGRLIDELKETLREDFHSRFYLPTEHPPVWTGTGNIEEQDFRWPCGHRMNFNMLPSWLGIHNKAMDPAMKLAFHRVAHWDAHDNGEAALQMEYVGVGPHFIYIGGNPQLPTDFMDNPESRARFYFYHWKRTLRLELLTEHWHTLQCMSEKRLSQALRSKIAGKTLTAGEVAILNTCPDLPKAILREQTRLESATVTLDKADAHLPLLDKLVEPLDNEERAALLACPELLDSEREALLNEEPYHPSVERDERLG